MQASAAFADDEVVTAVIPSDPTQDLIVSIVFVIAILLLLVLTGGVVYLSYMDWNDRRIETEERAKFERPSSSIMMNPNAPGAAPKREKPLTEEAVRKAAAKGFGPKKEADGEPKL